jgi:hypothetical protein
MLPHQLQQPCQLPLIQRTLADVDHHLRAIKKVRRLAKLIA